MAIDILYFEHPQPAYDRAKTFLEKDVLNNNVVLTLLEERIHYPQAGRYWVCLADQTVVGVGLQSPLNYGINLSTISPEASAELVAYINRQEVELPSVTGDSCSTSLFAGLWSEARNLGATPSRGMRLYEKEKSHPPTQHSGAMRQATAADFEVLVGFMKEFNEEIGEQAAPVEKIVQQRLEEGRFWIWEDQKPVAYACLSNPAFGTVRIQMVYTTKAERGKHYARTCTNIISNQLLEQGYRVMLYTDLSNPISNFVFRTIGFQAKTECMSYSFVSKTSTH